MVRILFAALLLALAGCAGPEVAKDPSIPQGGAASDALPPPIASLAAFAPARLRVHPLTRLERDEKGQLRVVCYLELADRFGHPCKWLGQSRIELYRPSDAAGDLGSAGGGAGGGASMAGGEVQQGVWHVDLADADRNSDKYDWVTRAYKFELAGLPDWVERFERGQAREPWITLRAYFLIRDAAGAERRLESSFRLRRAS